MRSLPGLMAWMPWQILARVISKMNEAVVNVVDATCDMICAITITTHGGCDQVCMTHVHYRPAVKSFLSPYHNRTRAF